ncbi:MAG: hypothetical protein JO234_11930 [Hyphomicrobiales bacterium]|nr:hypothetical protein [Hyphomicrobiales bacterium]
MTGVEDSKEAEKDRVGYGRPPKHTQFKKGNRANPRGRGAAQRGDLAEAVRETLSTKVEISQGGRKRRVTRGEANILALFDKARKGDAAAADRLLDLHASSAKRADGGPVVIDVFNVLPDEDGDRPAVSQSESDHISRPHPAARHPMTKELRR